MKFEEGSSSVGMPPGIQALIGDIVSKAKDNLENSGELLPVFFVGNSETHQIGIIGTPFTNDLEKDLASKEIRDIVTEAKADFVIFLAESWVVTVQETDLKLAQEEAHKFGRVSEHPDRREVVTVTIETKYGAWTGLAPIKTEAEGKKTFDADAIRFTRDESKGIGRFQGFLPKEVLH